MQKEAGTSRRWRWRRRHAFRPEEPPSTNSVLLILFRVKPTINICRVALIRVSLALRVLYLRWPNADNRKTFLRKYLSVDSDKYLPAIKQQATWQK